MLTRTVGNANFWTRIAQVLSAAALGLALAGCGGGGGSSAPLTPMVDSFGNSVPEAGFAGGDGDAAGADGTAGEGAAIPNALVRVVDSVGASRTTTTDVNGYYRIRVDGLVPPLIARVTKANGDMLYSPSITPVATRRFITINLTGLTDVIASDIAVAGGKSGSSQLTATLITSAALATAKANLNTKLAAVITSSGLNPATFDPVTLPFRPDLTGYDRVLENVTIAKDPNGATIVTPEFAVGGNISGLGARTGLVLRLTTPAGTQSATISANATTFTFAAPVTQSATYAVTVASQPPGATCTVTSGSGTIGAGPIGNVVVSCLGLYTLGGTVLPGPVAAILISTANQSFVQSRVAGGAFTFPNSLTTGTAYTVTAVSQEAGVTCSVKNNASGVMGTANVTNVEVECVAN